MNNKHRKTLEAIFSTPVRADLKWADIEALFKACGGVIKEGSGSRVWFIFDKKVATFHRPHPQPDTDKGAVKAVKRFFEQIEVRP